MQKKYPNCQPHMAYVKEHPFSSNLNPTLAPDPSPSPNPNQEHPSSSPCYGVHGRKKCEGFQLDPADPCNVQYYLFCEQLFKTAAQSWCPSPAGYPKHCCYAEALKEMDGGREVTPHRYLGQVFPETPVFK